MASPPGNVGIKAIEIYFPNRYVRQSDLESLFGASSGKYTIGLGQTSMSFCDDREDIYSLALSTVSSILAKYSIPPQSIGRLEVGTETLLDKSKSVKTVLMQLFPENPDIEGIDTYNACYGGTNALFNAINWIESSSWDGRDAIVVAGDIALYDNPAARPTGGAGCVAMLVGSDAPIVFDPFRASHMANVYDFYKPDFGSEYPLVDGGFSNRCYLEALGSCYRRYLAKRKTREGDMNGQTGGTGLDAFDYFLFHAPNCKLVAKAYGRLLYSDYLAGVEDPVFGSVPESFREMEYTASLTDKSLEKTFMNLTKGKFDKRVKPTLTASTMCGNMYTASLYSGLVSLVSNVPPAELQGKRVGLFSYGSGLASSLFSLRVKGDVSYISEKIDLRARLDKRRAVDPEVYDEACRMRERAYQQKEYTPVGNVDDLVSGTYHLVGVDGMFKRSYEVKE